MVELNNVERTLEAERKSAIPANEARSIAQEFLLRNMKDTMTAGDPSLLILDGSVAWRVPIIFVRADQVFGEVGEVLIRARLAEVIGWTPSDEVYRNARELLPS